MELREERKATLRRFRQEVADDVKDDLLYCRSGPVAVVAAVAYAAIGAAVYVFQAVIVDNVKAKLARRRGFEVRVRGRST
jgi:hypothetical protein